ncbi:FHA domain-containing protein FHA2-like, partial [Asparagus officinalis]|uniref:FHA domain-containing protein FHA2-like n=1 Tax=Asparagus officinalis TaxID=4686 RepID=UPI00098E79DC
RRHARIFYDFGRRRFALEVLGKNGCFVEGVLHVPGNPPVKLDSQDLLQIGDKRFYFLLPTRSIFTAGGPARGLPPPVSNRNRMDVDDDDDDEEEEEEEEEDGDEEEVEEEEEEEEEDVGIRRYGKGGKVALPPKKLEKKPVARSRADREADNLQLLKLEEKDVISCVATVLSDLCGPGEWMPMAKLHAELAEQYGNIWHHNRVRKYLTSEEWPQNETKGKPWYGLLDLLRKYPEHFVITTRSKGRITSEFVSLISLIS